MNFNVTAGYSGVLRGTAWAQIDRKHNPTAKYSGINKLQPVWLASFGCYLSDPFRPYFKGFKIHSTLIISNLQSG